MPNPFIPTIRAARGLVRAVKETVLRLPQRLCELIGQFFPETPLGCQMRGLLLRPFLKRCGRNFQVALGAKIEHGYNIEVGDHVYIGHGSWVSGIYGGIVLENEVMTGPFVAMVSSNHTFVDGSARFGPPSPARIVIGAGTWIAARVTITAGVRVGHSCLLAAGAVVCKDVPDGMCVGGVPAKLIGPTPSPTAP